MMLVLVWSAMRLSPRCFGPDPRAAESGDAGWSRRQLPRSVGAAQMRDESELPARSRTAPDAPTLTADAGPVAALVATPCAPASWPSCAAARTASARWRPRPVSARTTSATTSRACVRPAWSAPAATRRNGWLVYYERDEDAVRAASRPCGTCWITPLACNDSSSRSGRRVARRDGLAHRLVRALAVANRVAFDILGREEGSPAGRCGRLLRLRRPEVLLLLLGIVPLSRFLRSLRPARADASALAGRDVFSHPWCRRRSSASSPVLLLLSGAALHRLCRAGVPMGVTFAFLISSPLVNEVALVLLWGLFGPGIALLYIAAGLPVAIVGGLVIGRLASNAASSPGCRTSECRWRGGPRGAALDRSRCATPGATRDLAQRLALRASSASASALHPRLRADRPPGRLGGADNPLAVPLVVIPGGAALRQCGGGDPNRRGAARPRACRWARCSPS